MAIRIAQRPATPKRTYGYQRTEIVAALGHGVLLVCVSIYIFIEAFERASAPIEIQGAPMLAIATGGLIINAVGLIILSAGRQDSLNVRGAWLHVLSDALGSVGAITAGALIWAFGWTWPDVVASVFIGLMVIYSSWSLLRESLAVLMEAAPDHIDVNEVRRSISGLRNVLGVHDLHIWTVGSGTVSLSGHVVANDGVADGSLLRELNSLLAERFEIEHTTFQIEPQGFEEVGAVYCD